MADQELVENGLWRQGYLCLENAEPRQYLVVASRWSKCAEAAWLLAACRACKGRGKCNQPPFTTSPKLYRQVFKALEETDGFLNIPEPKAGMCQMVQQSVTCECPKPGTEAGVYNLCVVGKGGGGGEQRHAGSWNPWPRQPSWMNEFQVQRNAYVVVV